MRENLFSTARSTVGVKNISCESSCIDVWFVRGHEMDSYKR